MAPSDDAPPARMDARVARTRSSVQDAAVIILLEEGWDQLTHARVAQVAGCSKVTVYAHWPERVDLLRDAFTRVGDVRHHVPTGDLRHDLAAELRSFRTALVEHRLDRVLAVLADRGGSVPELHAVRERFVADGERMMRQILAPVTSGPRHEAAVLMLCGAMIHAVSLHGRPPSDAVIDAAVDLVVSALPPRDGPA